MGCVENKAASDSSEVVPTELRAPYWCRRKDPQDLTDELLQAYATYGCGGHGTVKAKDLQRLLETAYPEQVCQRQDIELMMRALGVKKDGVVRVHQLRAFVRNFFPGSPRIRPKMALIISSQADSAAAEAISSGVRGLLAHFDVVVSAGHGVIANGTTADAALAYAESNKVLRCLDTCRMMRILEEAGVTHLYCCGPSVNAGVASNATQGAAMGFKTTVIQDVFEPPVVALDRAKAELRNAGVRLKTSAEVGSEMEKLQASEVTLIKYLASLQPRMPVGEVGAAAPSLSTSSGPVMEE